MKRFVILTVVTLFAANTLASEFSVRLTDVLSAMTGYLEGNYFRAVLVQGEEDADLYLLAETEDGLRVNLHSRNFAVTGIGGSDAYLQMAENGSLQVVSLNEAIGRHRWRQTVTIIFRDHQFTVAGYTYQYYDTLAQDENGDVKAGICDVNLLTGKGTRDGKPILTEMAPVPVAQWDNSMSPPECLYE